MPAILFLWTGAVGRATAPVIFFLIFFMLSLSEGFIVPYQLYAATLDEVNQDAIRTQQQQQQRLEAIEDQSRERKTPAPQTPAAALSSADEGFDGQNCIVIKSIKVEGNTLLSERQLSSLTSNSLNLCLFLTDINKLLQEITREYFDRGYITTRAYLKPQDVSQEMLVITVIEGRIESIADVDGTPLAENEIRHSFPTSTGQILNLRELEQGLEILNRLQSNSARMRLEPGTDPGDSHILLTNEKTRSWHLGAGIDNGGQPATGEYQGHLTFGMDSPTGRADYLNLSMAHDLDSGRNKLSRSLSGLYEIPLNWWLLQISASASEYQKELHTPLQAFDTSGSSQNYHLSINRVLLRRQTDKTSAELTLNYKDERNYLEDVLLNSSSQTLTVVRGKIHHTRNDLRTWLGLGMTLHQGLPVFGSESDSNLPPDAPRAKFTKLTGTLSFGYNIPFSQFPLRYSMNANGQFCNTPLYGSEQISIGSLFTVRGYFDEGFSGTTGGYVRNELSSSILTPSLMRSNLIKVIEPFVAFDWGSVKSAGSVDNSFNDLAGWGIGLRGRGEYGRVDLLYARPIQPPEPFIDHNGKLSFSVSVYL